MSKEIPIILLGSAIGLYFLSGSAVQSAVVESVKSVTGDKSLPRGIQNNNPLNIKYSKANNWRGQTGTDGSFSIFDSPVNGIRAAARLLMTYKNTYGLNTINKITRRWSPDVNGLSGAYGASVAKYSGIGVNTVLSLSTSQLAAIIRAMIAVENGAKYLNYYSDAVINSGVSA
jgi:hypothetical protein